METSDVKENEQKTSEMIPTWQMPDLDKEIREFFFDDLATNKDNAPLMNPKRLEMVVKDINKAIELCKERKEEITFLRLEKYMGSWLKISFFRAGYLRVGCTGYVNKRNMEYEFLALCIPYTWDFFKAESYLAGILVAKLEKDKKLKDLFAHEDQKRQERLEESFEDIKARCEEAVELMKKIYELRQYEPSGCGG